MLVVGVVCWLGWSHLVGRFAVTLLVPTAVLFGIGWAALSLLPGRRIYALALTALLAYHAYASTTLLLPTLLRPTRQLAGQTALLPLSIPHLERLNGLVAAGARVLMVGDARRYYLDPGVDYCVVFNRNPFAEAAADRSPADLLDWLRTRRYDYVYVDWLEMNRLRSSRYGFWPSINVELFQKLCDAGLKPIEQFTLDDGRQPYATLYAVPAPPSP
jgi:hypothetical protein